MKKLIKNSRAQLSGKITWAVVIVSALAALVAVCVFPFARAQTGPSATVVMDKADYPPGGLVTITGSGFLGGERVVLQVVHVGTDEDDDLTHPAHQPWEISADTNGAIQTTWTVPLDGDELGETLLLTAYGRTSQRLATTTFTDAIGVALEGWFNTSLAWSGSTANGVNSSWKENDVIPLRFVLAGVEAGGTYTAILSYDFYDSGDPAQHLFDSLRTYNVTTSPDPASGIAGLPAPTTVPIPVDTSATGMSLPTGNFTLYNIASFTPPAAYTLAVSGPAAGRKSLSVTFTVAGVAGTGSKNVVIAYGAHLASYAFWGAGNGASSFPGASGKAYVELVGEGTANFSINPGSAIIPPTPTTTTISAPTITYGQNGLVTVTVTQGSGVIVPSGSVTLTIDGGAASLPQTLNASGSATFNTVAYPALTAPAAGSHSLSASYTPSGYFLPSTGSGTLLVNKAPLTVKADDKVKTYDGLVYSPFTVTYTGFVLSETATVLGGTLAFTGNATTAVNVGSYTITPGGLTSSNYDITFQNGTLEIRKGGADAVVVVTAANNGKVYGDSEPTLIVTQIGFLSADVAGITLAATRAPGETVGTYVITPTATGGNVANYNVTYVAGTFTITGRPATVTATSNGKVYGAVEPTLAATQTGFLSADVAGITLSATRVAGESVGTYVMTAHATGGNVGNYSITYVPGTFTITGKAATVTATDNGKVYGAVEPTLAATQTGFLSADVAGITLSATRVAGESVGSYVMTASATGGNVGNYTITYVPGTFTITAKTATVTATDNGKVYGAMEPTLAATQSGFLSADVAGITLSATRVAGESVGTYVMTAHATGGNVGNYTITYVPGTFTITAKTATVTATDNGKVYGAVEPTLAATQSGFLSADVAGITLSATRVAGESVGTYVMTAHATGGNVGNYSITYVPGTFTITGKAATVTATDNGKVYGAVEPTLAATQTGFLSADVAGITLSATRVAGESVGSYVMTASATGGNVGNYTITYVPGTFTITAKTATVTATSNGKVYGTVEPTLAATQTGFLSADVAGITLSATRVAGESVGTYVMTAHATGGNVGNYSITYVPGTFTITAKTATVTATSNGKVYGTVEPTLAATQTGFLSADVAGITLSATRVAGESVGTYVMTAHATGGNVGNYSITYVPGTFTITAKTATVTATSNGKIYGAADPTLGATQSGFLSADVAGITLSATRAPGENVGTYVMTATATGGNVGNYSITYVAGTFTINKAALTVKADDKAKTYDGLVYSPFTVSYTGLVNGDTSAALGGTLLYGGTAPAAINVGTYTIIPSGLTSSNYTITFQNGTLTITQRPGIVAYIGQTLFISSGSSATTAQVTLSASVADPGTVGFPSLATATVTFRDMLTNSVLASGVKVSPVANSGSITGTANTIVTLSTGQYGAQCYLIEVTLTGNYQNTQQTGAAPGSDPYKATHPIVTVAIPTTKNSLQAAGGLNAGLPQLPTAAGVYGTGTLNSFTAGMNYTSKGTNTQGKIELIIEQADGTYYIKSNSITSVAFSNPVATINKDVTIYTKASIYKVGPGGITSVDGNVTLRSDYHDGGSPLGDTVGFTVLSSKDGKLYYSNNWVYDSVTLSWRTVQQPTNVAPNAGAIVQIN